MYISVHLNVTYYWVKPLINAIQTLVVIKNYPTMVKIIIVEYTITNLTKLFKITNDIIFKQLQNIKNKLHQLLILFNLI